MKALFAIVLSIVLLPATKAAGQPTAPPTLERHEFVVRNFKTESGDRSAEARLVYTTLGRLNAGGTNAILLPSHYMADINGYNWLIGSSGRPRLQSFARFPDPHGAVRQRTLFVTEQHT